jgi:nucleotide-binding universal stress UspA family protein
MMQWKEICCAVDFGDPSRVAMEQAAELAKRFEAQLTLVHVVVPPLAAESDVLVSSRGVAAVEAQEREEQLARWRADAERRAGRPVRSRVLSGDPAGEILRYTREERCDLLVVGTHGRKGIARVVLGSVAERAARESPCPVLVVHDHGALEKADEGEEIGQYR